jgi:hypothetical protein
MILSHSKDRVILGAPFASALAWHLPCIRLSLWLEPSFDLCFFQPPIRQRIHAIFRDVANLPARVRPFWTVGRTGKEWHNMEHSWISEQSMDIDSTLKELVSRRCLAPPY